MWYTARGVTHNWRPTPKRFYLDHRRTRYKYTQVSIPIKKIPQVSQFSCLVSAFTLSTISLHSIIIPGFFLKLSENMHKNQLVKYISWKAIQFDCSTRVYINSLLLLSRSPQSSLHILELLLDQKPKIVSI
jgi:hypothetical protein